MLGNHGPHGVTVLVSFCPLYRQLSNRPLMYSMVGVCYVSYQSVLKLDSHATSFYFEVD